jgi:copper chaperone CopZ
MAKMGLFEWSGFNFAEQQHQMRHAINPRQRLQARSLPCELCEHTVEKVLETIPDESVQLNIKLQKLEKIVDSVGSLAVVLDMPHERYTENRDLADNFNYYANNQSGSHELAVLTTTLIMNHAVDLHTGTGKGKGKGKADFYDNESS